jgi:hypothetical protein
LERDRIKARVHTLEAQVQQLQAEKAAATKAPATPKPPRPKRGADSKLPPRDSVPNPYASLTFDPPGIERYQLRRTFKGHVNAVSAAAFHPHKPILARTRRPFPAFRFPTFLIRVDGVVAMPWRLDAVDAAA